MSERHHWILSSFHENDVSIYDSLSSLLLTASVDQQLIQVYGATVPHGSNGLLVSSVPVQQQGGECDCGLFVNATALHISAGNNTEEVPFESADKDAKPPHAVFREENPLTFSTDEKESQVKYACKHSHSCVLPMW